MPCICPSNEYIQSTVNGVVICTKTTTVAPIVTTTIIPINFDNTEYFEDVSWTIAYKPTDQSWVSYYSYKPDYYINYNDYFRTGHNYGIDKESLWNHNLNNMSFNVFQGRLEPFIVEVPLTNQNVNKVLNTITLDVEAKRYQNEWDYTDWKGVGFNKVVVYNDNNNSGLLKLNQQKKLTDLSAKEEVFYTTLDGKHTFNYFYNRVKNQDNNIPIWLNDKSRINKRINNLAIAFTGKSLLERMKGNTFLVRLIQDSDSRHNILLKNIFSKETVYDS